MTTKVRLSIVGLTLVAVASLIGLSGTTQAGDEKALKTAVAEIAEALKKGDKEKAKTLAAAAAKKIDEIDTLMHLFKTRTKGGLGYGSKALSNPAKDGIEVKLRDLEGDASNKDSEAGEEVGYWVAALAEISIAKVPTKSAGKKTPKAWTDFSEDMRDAGVAFSKASAAKGAQEIKTAAAKVNAACNNCHSIFKE